MGHEGFRGQVIEVLSTPRKPFDGLLGLLPDGSVVITLPVAASPRQPALPGPAVPDVLPMLADEGESIGVVGPRQVWISRRLVWGLAVAPALGILCRGAWHPQHNRACDRVPVLALSTVVVSPFVVPDRATGQWASGREGMRELPGGLVFTIAGVRWAPLVGDLRTLHTAADNANHAVPFGLCQGGRVVSTMPEPGTAGHNGLELCRWA